MSKSELGRIERDLYKTQRAVGDVRAVETGGAPKLAKRLVRRRVTRSLLRGLWR